MNNSNPIVTVFIVNYNSADFIDISLYALSKLSGYPYKVVIRDNNSNLRDYQKLVNICRKYPNTKVVRSHTPLRGSLAHGTALNYLCKNINTPYFSILDADAIWLIKNWDKILINKLNKKVKAIGTQVALDSNKPKDFPIMFSILFETKTFKNLNIDFRPDKSDIVKDTGYQLREKYLSNHFLGKIIEMRNTRVYHSGPFKNVICAEYYLDTDYNNIFSSHFSRGSSLGKAKYIKNMSIISPYRIPFFGDYLLQLKGMMEKHHWINICRKIIDSQ
ncbi:MAG: glycosyltransferase [Candidatus Shapirobacteria bacterium]|jgi:hypothetical protein